MPQAKLVEMFGLSKLPSCLPRTLKTFEPRKCLAAKDKNRCPRSLRFDHPRKLSNPTSLASGLKHKLSLPSPASVNKRAKRMVEPQPDSTRQLLITRPSVVEVAERRVAKKMKLRAPSVNHNLCKRVSNCLKKPSPGPLQVGMLSASSNNARTRSPGLKTSAAEQRWCKFSKVWCQTIGSVAHPKHGGQCRTVWLSRKPARFGNSFGVGCTFCSFFSESLKSQADKSKPSTLCPDGLNVADLAKKAKLRVHTKWSRFEVDTLSNMQSSSFRKHSTSTLHRLATRFFFNPDAAACVLVDPVEETKLFCGHVPQPATYLKVWRLLHNPASFNDMEAITLTAKPLNNIAV
jgi:hypothetical protein